MSAFKATKRASNVQNNTNAGTGAFKATKYKGFDETMVYDWETTNKQSLDILNDYNNRINKSEWLDEEERKKYRSALDSYIETSNYLRDINKMFGEGYTAEDEKKWADSIASMNSGYDEINSFYSQFASDKVYNNWQSTIKADEEYEGYFKSIDAEKGAQGRQKYLDDEKAQRDALIAESENASWWDKVSKFILEAAQMGSQMTDTTLPMGTYTSTVNALREDQSYRRPGEDWTEDQLNKFGELYLESPATAYDFAEETNKRNAKKKEEDAVKKIQENATSGFWAGLGNTIGAIASAPLGLADYLNDLAYAGAGREIAPDGNISPFEYSQAVTGGISANLNEMGGTLPDDWWIVGGKGWGDVYGLGTSIAQSMVSGYTLGGVGTLVSYFGQGAAAGVDDALSRGATDEQALLYGAALGTFEGVAEKMGIDNLFKLGSSSTVKGLIKNILKQAGAEGMEEGATAVFSNIADAFIMQDKSNFAYQIAEYMNGGMSESDAKWRVFWDSLEGIAFDTIAGAASGSVSGGIHSGVQTAVVNADAKKNYSGQVEGLLTDAASVEGAGKTVDKLVDKYGKKGELSGWDINHLLEITDTAKVKSSVEGQLTKLGESGDVSRLADIITKQVQGIELSKKEQAVLDGSTFGQRIVNTLDREKIKSGMDDTDWAKGIGTRRLNADVYNKSLGDVISEAMSAEREGNTLTTVRENVEAELTKLGEGENASAIAVAMVKKAAGVELSEEESQLIENSEYASKVEQSYDIGGAVAEAMKTEAVTENATVEENATEGKIGGSESAKITIERDDEAVEVTPQRIASIDGENMTVELDGGEVVDVSEVDFGESGVGLVYQAAMDMSSRVGGFSVDTANVFVRGYNAESGVSAGEYVNGWISAYKFGAMKNPPPLSALAANPATSKLTEEQRKNAYNFGRAFGNEKIVNTVTKNAENISKTDSKKKKGRVVFDGAKYGKTLNERQRASLKALNFLANALGIDIHIFESPTVNGKRKGENGWYDSSDRSIHIDLYAGAEAEALMIFTAAHEITHHIREVLPEKFNVLADAIFEEYTKRYGSHTMEHLVDEKKAALKDKGRITEDMSDEEAYDLAYEEVIADCCETLLVDSNAIEALSKNIYAKDKGLWNAIKKYIANLVARIKAAFNGADPDSTEGVGFRALGEGAERIKKLWVEAIVEASDVDSDIIKKDVANKDTLFNLRAAEKHKLQLEEQYTKDAAISLNTLMQRYNKILSIWEKLGGELNSKFLKEWDSKIGKDRAFTVFKAQAGYKYNVELSSMCKKGVPLFEAIDTIVKQEVMKELDTEVLGKEEKEILYDILKDHNFEIPCAICYVEQARQREGVIIDAFLNGKVEKNSKGKITTFKLGWNEVLKSIEKEMKANGVDYTFAAVDRSIATDTYSPADISMDEATQEAFYNALKKIANKEIARYNKAENKNRKLVTSVTPAAIKEVFGGTLPSNLKIFKVLFTDPTSRFTLASDLLYSSMTTHNLANSHNALYSLFNSQGGVSGYKTKQGTVVYWGDILGKKWIPSKVRDEGGIRNQSNSDFQMYTLLDQAQMYIDFTAKGYYLQAYTKVLAELKLFGLSRGKINASLIPAVYEYKNADGTVDVETTKEFAGLDANGELLFDDFEGIDHAEAFMLLEDAEYSKSLGGICIGYSDNHILKLLDDQRVQQIIGFHDKTDDPDKRYRGARYSKNYNGLNEAVKFDKDGTPTTVHIGFNPYVRKAEKKFKYDTETETYAGEIVYNGKTYVADDIPKLAADMYLDMCEEKGYDPAYKMFAFHENYYKLLADFSLYDSEGHYAPHRKVAFNMPDSVPYLDSNGNKKYMPTKDYIKAELQKELKVRDSISEALADTSENGIIPQFKKRVNEAKKGKKKASDRASQKASLSDRDSLGNELSEGQIEFFKDSKARDEDGNLLVLYHGTSTEQRIAEFKTTEGWRTGLWLTTDHETAVHFARVTEYLERDPSDDTKLFTKGNSVSGDGRQGVYELYANVKNPLIVDAQGKRYWEIPRPSVMGKGDAVSGEEINTFAFENGYDGVIIKDVIEGSNRLGTDVIVFSQNQVKYTDNLTPTEGNDIRFSDRAEKKASYAPIFYSHMGKVIDDVKLEKMGTSSILNHLKNRGVKDEEIKWSGIETFLEGKKSVTKAELQEFIAGSQLVIEEEMSDPVTQIDLREGGETDDYAYILYDKDGNELDRFSYDYAGELESEKTGETFLDVETLEEEIRRDSDNTRWSQYKLDGGENYRELVFKLPDSSYTNRAMRGHWGQDAEGILVHARIQDFEVDGKKMLFIEELQSDWHNEGHEKGYSTKEYEDAVDSQDALYDKYKKLDLAFHKYVRSNDFMTDPEDVRKKKSDWLRGKAEAAYEKYLKSKTVVDSLKGKGMGDVADAPFKSNYHEYVLKRLLRMAAEEGYDSIGWTPADIQSKRWSEDYAEAYRIEYDQEMPKFLRKYGKKWGATVGTSYVNPVANSKDYIADNEKDIEEYKRQIDEIGEDSSENEYVQFLTEGIADLQANIEKYKGTKVWSMDITDSMTESVLYEGQVMYSDRVTNKKTLDFLENQEHITTYKSFVEIDGKLYSPMATKVKGDDGKYRLTNPSEIGVWQQAEEKPESIPKFHKSGYGYYVLKKDDGGSITAAYNPYEHSSNLVLNDQFEAAYQRPNLVTVECVIPKSEMTSGYKAKYAKDSTGYLDWKSGTVAGKLKGNKRKVYLSRWLKPVRILSDAEVASMYKDILGSNISVPFNVVTPQLLAELEKVGVKIDYEGSPGYQYRQSKKADGGDSKFSDRNPNSSSNRSLLANALEGAAQNDIEREKLKQYKEKIDLINSEEQKLHELRAQIKELSFKKGARDTEAIKSLQFEANQTANRINTYDKQLLNLESTVALKGVLEREKAMLRKRLEQKAEQRRKEDVARAKERAAKTERELMNRYQESRQRATESRNKTAMRHKIKGIVSELNTLLLRPTAKKHIKEELRKEVADALSAINMDTVDADERVAKYNALIARENDPDIIAELTKTRDNIQLQGDNLKEKLNNLQMAYEKIKNTEDIELNLAYQEVIQNSIKAVSEKVGKTSIRNMTLEQLEMVYDLFKMIRHTIRDANKAFKAKKGETIMQMAEAVNDQVRTVGGQPYKRNAISAAVQRVLWTFLKPFVAFRTIGSVTLTNLYKNLRAGEDTFYGDVREAQEFIEAQYKKHGYKSWDMKKTKTFTAKSGKTFDLTLEQMMTLYAYSKRDQAHDHIIEGGIVFEDAIITEKNKWGVPIKYEVTTKDAFNLSEETFAEIANSLTAEQKAFVDAMQDYLSTTMGEKGNEVSMELLGVKLFKEKFYLPIKSSQYYMNFKAEEAGEVKLKSPAFSKETVKHANNPIVVHNFTDLWAEHINDMSMYHSFVLALEDFTRVYNYKTKTDDKVETMDTKATLETAYPGVTKYIEKFLKDMNGGVRSETVGWAETLTSLAKKGAVLGSLSVTIQQPSAVMRAMAMVNPKYFVTTAHKSVNLAKHKQDFEELKKYAPIAGIKEMGRFDVGMGQGTVDWIKSDKTAMNKVEDTLSAAPAYMDEVTWVSIWNAVKRETAHNNPTLNTNSEEFLKLAGERFTEVISLTQVYDSVFARSDLMRNKSAVAKWLTAFMAEPTTTLNMLWDSWVQAKRTGGFKAYAKATTTTGGAIIASIVLNAALKSIIMAMRDDDEDESYAEKYLEHFVGDLKDNLNPLTLIPFVKDIVSIFKGYDVERMDMALFSDLKKAIDAFDSDSKTVYEKWSGLVGAISAFFGVPIKNVERDIHGLINTIFGKTEDTTVTGILNAIEEGWSGKDNSNGKQLYDAYLKGDTEQIERVKGRFEDENAANTALRKALRENDLRIKEAAEAFIKGDYNKYNALRAEIVAEGHFSVQIVTDALKAEYNYLKKKAEEDK